MGATVLRELWAVRGSGSRIKLLTSDAVNGVIYITQLNQMKCNVDDEPSSAFPL